MRNSAPLGHLQGGVEPPSLGLQHLRWGLTPLPKWSHLRCGSLTFPKIQNLRRNSGALTSNHGPQPWDSALLSPRFILLFWNLPDSVILSGHFHLLMGCVNTGPDRTSWSMCEPLCASTFPDLGFPQLLMLILVPHQQIQALLLIYLKALVQVQIFSMFLVNFFIWVIKEDLLFQMCHSGGFTNTKSPKCWEQPCSVGVRRLYHPLCP